MKDHLNDSRPGNLGPKLPASFDPPQVMRQLAEYIKWLEDELSDIKRTYALEINHLANRRRDVEALNSEQLQELDRLKQDLIDLTKVLEERDSALSAEIRKSESLEKLLHRHSKEVEGLEAKLMLKIKQADMLKADNDRLSLENERLAAERHRLEHKIGEQDLNADSDRNKAAAAEKESRRLQLELLEVHGKFALTEKKLEDMEFKHAEEIRRWQERLQNESEHELNLLKKRLSTNIGPDLLAAKKLMAEKPSLETCSNYRLLVNRLVAKLEQVGLETDPEE